MKRSVARSIRERKEIVPLDEFSAAEVTQLRVLQHQGKVEFVNFGVVWIGVSQKVLKGLLARGRVWERHS